MYRNILVPLDGSIRSEVVLPYVEDLAQHYETTVILLRVVDLAAPIGAVEKAYANLRQEEMERHTRDAQAYLSVQQGILRSKGVQAETAVAYGRVLDAILKTTHRVRADIVVLSSHGRRVASGLLQRATCPLLIIPAGEQV